MSATMPSTTYTAGTVTAWDAERGRGELRAHDGDEVIVADLQNFNGFSTTVFVGLTVRFLRTWRSNGWHAADVRPVTE